jgi:hypothetical protein
VPFWHSIGDCGPGSLERRSVRYGEVRTGKAMAASSMLQACFKHAATLADFEGGKRRPYSRTLADLRRAFEAAGVEFIIDGLHLTFVTRGAAEPTHSSKPMGGNPGAPSVERHASVVPTFSRAPSWRRARLKSESECLVGYAPYINRNCHTPLWVDPLRTQPPRGV